MGFEKRWKVDVTNVMSQVSEAQSHLGPASPDDARGTQMEHGETSRVSDWLSPSQGKAEEPLAACSSLTSMPQRA